MTISFSTATNPFAAKPSVTFTPAKQDVPDAGMISELPSAFLDAQYKAMDAALEAGNVTQYLRAKRSIRAHMRFHAMQTRDASRFPITHDDHLAQTAHQFGYHGRGDVERMTVGLAEVGEWRPPLLRSMDASAGAERVTYDVKMPERFPRERFTDDEGNEVERVLDPVPVTYTTSDRLTISQRDSIHFDRDRDELPSDYTLSSIAAAEFYGCSVDDLDRGMSAKPRPNLPTCD